ncbi:MAG: GGDEF domain-containing phosphodiesterase [Planctomycetes bacterium]|nr:GGDEF domain-containing phosphodiesterase [Planctomycetota bacterium]
MHREDTHSAPRLLSSAEFESRLNQATCRPTEEAQDRLVLIGFGGQDDLVSDHGTEATRAALTELGARITSVIPAGHCAAHLFGDRFAVLVNEAEEVEQVTEQLLNALRQPASFHEQALTLRPRFGIAKAQDATDAQDLVRRGTAALQRAESIGGRRPTLYQTQAMPLHATDPRLAEQLHDALEGGQIKPWFQPIHRTTDGSLVGVEALARWEHPERGIIPPAVFLPLARRAGVLSRLDALVRCQAMHWLARVHREHHEAADLTVSVNIADADLVDIGLPEQVLAELEHYGLSTSSLCLELSERAETAKSPEVQGRIREMERAGLRWHLDDFGTGQSNIQRLKGLPFKAVKLDRSMIKGLGRDSHTAQLLKPIVTLARVLDLEVIAEGVERGEQLRTLRALGCDMAQGHHLSPPRPAAAVEAMLSSLVSKPQRALEAAPAADQP